MPGVLLPSLRVHMAGRCEGGMWAVRQRGQLSKERNMGEIADWIPCKNPLCDRIVSNYGLYCCTSCARAHEGKYQIHNGGILGHSEQCKQRAAARAKKE